MKVISFAPFAQISQHDGALKVVAESLSQAGAEVVTVRCNTLLSHGCLILESQLSEDREKRTRICSECKMKARFSDRKSGNRVLYLDDFFSLADHRAVNEEMGQVSQANVLERYFRGIPVARFSMFEVSLNLKLMPGIPIPDAHWDTYLRTYRAALVVACTVDQIFQQENPDRLITYNSRYSSNRVACWLSDERDIPNFSLHAGSHHVKRYEQLTIEQGIGEHYFLNRSADWLQRQSQVLTRAEIGSVRKHLDFALKAKSYWTYSTALDQKSDSEVHRALGISGRQGFVLALMSSLDERAAWEYAKVSEVSQGGVLFKDQWEWLAFLIKHFEANPTQTLVIRPHPREFPNKREQVTSQAARYIEALARKTTAQNIVFNFPEDGVSLYDLFKSASFVLNSSSSGGLEAVLFGKYVLGNGDVLTAYPPEIHAQPTSLEEYAALISTGQFAALSFLEIRLAYRWLSFVTGSFPIDISGYFDWRPLRQIIQMKARNLVVYAEKKHETPAVAKVAKSLARVLYFFLPRRQKKIDSKTSLLLNSKILGNPKPTVGRTNAESRNRRLFLECLEITRVFRRSMKLAGIEKTTSLADHLKLVLNQR
jgi:hypothetical protein